MLHKFNVPGDPELDDGKVQSLLGFSKLLSKKGEYRGDFSCDFMDLSKRCFFPMISELTGEKLLSEENEFDEAKYALQQYSSKVVHTQLDVNKAKSGDKVEIMKFFAALVYEYRVSRSGEFSPLCDAMTSVDQLHMAHFISYMDNAIKVDDNNWWKILFLPYSDDDLIAMGVSLYSKAVHASHKISSRNLFTDGKLFETPIPSTINSPTSKDRIIQQHERQLKAERALVQTLQLDYDEANTENVKLKLEIENLKDKLSKATRSASSTCADECPNKNDLAGMRLKMNVRDNKIQQLTADLLIANQDFESLSGKLDEQRLSTMQLEERNQFLIDENDRLSYVLHENLDLRSKVNLLNKELEAMTIQNFTADDVRKQANLLVTENEALKTEIERLSTQLRAEEQTIDSMKSGLGSTNKKLNDANEELNDLKTKLSSADEELNDLKTKLNIATEKLRGLEMELDSAKKAGAKTELGIPRKRVKPTEDFLVSVFGRPKPIETPADLAITSFMASNLSSFPVPVATSSPLNPLNRPVKSLMKRDKPKPQPKTRSVSSNGGITRNFVASSNPVQTFKYNNDGRLNVLRERNKNIVPHLRSHYAVEIDASFSPQETMKFDP